ncbi:hypothetical protein AB0E27_15300 [Streptomyces sparsogenes]|uniref:hypothetical protein n=1 Tax=Streptomyces sparsogenes TaxID=67365 RepID=UPI00340D5317
MSDDSGPALDLLTSWAERAAASKADKGSAVLAEAARLAADRTASPEDLRAVTTLLRCTLADMIMVVERRERQIVQVTGLSHDADDRSA